MASYLTAFELGPWLFSCLHTQTKTLALSGSQACWPLDENHTISSPGSDAFGLEVEVKDQLS